MDADKDKQNDNGKKKRFPTLNDDQAAAVRTARKKLAESNRRIKNLRTLNQDIEKVRGQIKDPEIPTRRNKPSQYSIVME